jgi:hypothetical protein
MRIWKRTVRKGQLAEALPLTAYFLLFVVLVFILPGCAGRAPRPTSELGPRELYLQVAENYRRLQTFRGNGRLTIEMPKFQFSAPAQIFALKPDSLFIKVEAGFGVDVGFFFADRRHFASFSPLENIYYYGEVEKMRELVLFRMELTYDEMMSGMIGAALPPFDDSFVVMRDGDEYRFEGWRKQSVEGATGTNGNSEVGWQLTYWVNPARGIVTKAEQRDADGKLYARQEFKRFRRMRNVWLPQLIQMERPSEQERLTIFYNHVEANTRISPSEFAIRVPENTKRIKISSPADLPEPKNLLKE